MVEAITALLLGRHAGAFNVAGDGLMTMRECAELIGSPIRKMPLRAYRGLRARDVGARQSEAPPGQIEFASTPGSCRPRSSSGRPAGGRGHRAARPSRSRCERTASCRRPRPDLPPRRRCYADLRLARGPLAQLGERRLDKPEVAGGRAPAAIAGVRRRSGGCGGVGLAPAPQRISFSLPLRSLRRLALRVGAVHPPIRSRFSSTSTAKSGKASNRLSHQRRTPAWPR